MKILLSSIILFFCINGSKAHTFYFAHAELEYKALTNKFELTLSLTAHDLEVVFGNKQIVDETLPEDPIASDFTDSVERYINSHFVLSNTLFRSNFKLAGTILESNGILNLFLEADASPESNETEPMKSFEVSFDLFMESFELQENKLTCIHQGKYTSLSFNQFTKQKQLILD